ncbi:phosphotransferase [Shimia sp.]|uniref:aminoglycoside phosphotransferase family protein n=1 Tax=Shimia sp. TaxID=1954381 RepID=UPI003296BBC6
MTRKLQINEFLHDCGWSSARRAPLAGDASNRRYERLTLPSGNRAVLMDAPPGKNDSVDPFANIAQHLTNAGFSAPRIYAKSAELGLLLLEDLGDALFARLAIDNPDLELSLYQAATDVLIDLRKAPAPTGLVLFDADRLTGMIDLFFDWYMRGCGLESDEYKTSVSSSIHEILRRVEPPNPVLILRDYHAENLIWLPERHGVARVGLLDFQDAVIGHPAYDLVSLLQDARRDVSADLEQKLMAYYLDATELDRAHFETAYFALGLQRNMRILGIFARLSRLQSKPHYIDYIPRVWSYLTRTVQHPSLTPVRDFFLSELPAPTPALLQKLKDA